MKKEESRNSHAEEPKCTWGKEIEHKLTYTTKPPKKPTPDIWETHSTKEKENISEMNNKKN